MKIGILGAGSLGSVFGGVLAEGGHEVTLFTRSEEYREAVDVLMGKRWAWEAEFRDSWGYSCAKREAYSRYAGLKLAAEGEDPSGI